MKLLKYNEMAKLKARNVQMIDVQDWDRLVQETYGKPYSFQQQEGCKSRGVFHLTVPSEETYDEEMHDSIPEVVNGDVMGVKFKTWLERDPKEWNGKKEDQIFINLWWARNFYPNIHTVANDLYMKGLIDAGDYSIDIDW